MPSEKPQPPDRQKLFGDECRDVDPDMNAPVPVYEFRGRVFKEKDPYEPAK